MDWDEDLVQGNGATGVSASQVVLQAIKSNALAPLGRSSSSRLKSLLHCRPGSDSTAY